MLIVYNMSMLTSTWRYPVGNSWMSGAYWARPVKVQEIVGFFGPTATADGCVVWEGPFESEQPRSMGVPCVRAASGLGRCCGQVAVFNCLCSAVTKSMNRNFAPTDLRPHVGPTLKATETSLCVSSATGPITMTWVCKVWPNLAAQIQPQC